MLNQHIFKVTPLDGTSKAWLRHAIEASYQDMRRKQVGMGMFHLRRRDFLGHPVPKLSLPAQEHHATRLDELENAARRLDSDLARSRALAAELVLPALSAAAGVHDAGPGRLTPPPDIRAAGAPGGLRPARAAPATGDFRIRCCFNARWSKGARATTEGWDRWATSPDPQQTHQRC